MALLRAHTELASVHILDHACVTKARRRHAVRKMKEGPSEPLCREIDVIAFQEKGVKRDDGVIRFLQANAIEFTDRHTLPNVVADMVRQRAWMSNWRNELILERSPAEFGDALQVPAQAPVTARFFHINVRNLHRERLATNCCVYLEKAIKRPDTTFSLKTIEYKWAGTFMAAVGIAPGTTREFDAFRIQHHRPTQLLFGALTDSTEYLPRIPPGIGEYEFSYVVMAENFAPARGTFTLDLRAALPSFTFIAPHSRARGADDRGRRRRDASYGVARDNHPVSTIR